MSFTLRFNLNSIWYHHNTDNCSYENYSKLSRSSHRNLSLNCGTLHRLNTLSIEIKHALVQNVPSQDLWSARNSLSRLPCITHLFTSRTGAFSSSGSRRHRFRLESRGQRFSCFRDSRPWRVTVVSWRLWLSRAPGVIEDIVATRVAVTIVRWHSYSNGFVLSVH